MDREWSRLAALDSKAGNLVGHTGVIIGIVIGTTWSIRARLISNLFLAQLFSLAVAMLFISFLIGLASFAVRGWPLLPDPDTLIDHYADGSLEYLLTRVGATMVAVQKTMKAKNEAKAQQMRLASLFLLVGLFLSFIFVLYAIW